jgi:hypothetical protein
LSLIGDEFILAVGGLKSDSVNLYIIETGVWIFVGKMQTVRYGAFSMYDDNCKTVYIAGGKDIDDDNTLDVEYFSISDLDIIEIKVKVFKEGFTLRRSFPIPLQFDSKTFIICGGNGLLFSEEDIDTTTICNMYTESCKIITGQHDSFSSKNPNVYCSQKDFYFFIKDDEVIKFSLDVCKFSLIKRQIDDEI